MPTASATERAPVSSPVASAGETAVTASARSPERALGEGRDERGVDAARERDDDAAELAQPLLDPFLRRSRAGLRGGQRGRPDALDGPSERRGGARAVVVLGCEVDDLAVQQAELDAHAVARRR